MIWSTQCRFCQFMVLSNEISDRSILYQKCLSEIHNKLNRVRWEVDIPEKNEKPELAKKRSRVQLLPDYYYNLLHRKYSSPLPTSLAEGFANFFTDKISKLHISLTSNTSTSSPHSPPLQLNLPVFLLSGLNLNLNSGNI